ncbi:MFS transporter [Isoptericola cucumis]|uniref:MFS transporter n=1 Tax=Isoptericola cucumis TaxID=1776856 RepID=UPI003208E8F6
MAGSISGLFGLGNALGLSVQGSLMDRVGQRPVVLAAGATCTVALASFGLAGAFGGPVWLVAVLAGLAGVTVPAITTAVRAWLAIALLDEGHRGASYALLSALFQTAVTVGPVLVSLSLLVRGPVLAVGAAAVMTLAATVLYSVTGSGHGPPHLARAPQVTSSLWTPGLVTLLVAAGLEGVAAGMTAVAVPGVMTEAGSAPLAGVGFAALAIGEVLGALVFGSRTWAGSRGVQLPVVQCGAAPVAALVCLASPQTWLLVIAMCGAGVAIAPSSVLKSALLDVVGDEAAVARSYSLLVAAGLVAAAAGNALAGLLVESTGVNGLLAFPVLALALATAWTAARRRTLHAEPPAPRR